MNLKAGEICQALDIVHSLANFSDSGEEVRAKNPFIPSGLVSEIITAATRQGDQQLVERAKAVKQDLVRSGSLSDRHNIQSVITKKIGKSRREEGGENATAAPSY